MLSSDDAEHTEPAVTWFECANLRCNGLFAAPVGTEGLEGEPPKLGDACLLCGGVDFQDIGKELEENTHGVVRCSTCPARQYITGKARRWKCGECIIENRCKKIADSRGKTPTPPTEKPIPNGLVPHPPSRSRTRSSSVTEPLVTGPGSDQALWKSFVNKTSIQLARGLLWDVKGSEEDDVLTIAQMSKMEARHALLRATKARDVFGCVRKSVKLTDQKWLRTCKRVWIEAQTAFFRNCARAQRGKTMDQQEQNSAPAKHNRISTRKLSGAHKAHTKTLPATAASTPDLVAARSRPGGSFRRARRRPPAQEQAPRRRLVTLTATDGSTYTMDADQLPQHAETPKPRFSAFEEMGQNPDRSRSRSPGRGRNRDDRDDRNDDDTHKRSRRSKSPQRRPAVCRKTQFASPKVEIARDLYRSGKTLHFGKKPQPKLPRDNLTEYVDSSPLGQSILTYQNTPRHEMHSHSPESPRRQSSGYFRGNDRRQYEEALLYVEQNPQGSHFDEAIKVLRRVGNALSGQRDSRPLMELSAFGRSDAEPERKAGSSHRRALREKRRLGDRAEDEAPARHGGRREEPRRRGDCSLREKDKHFQGFPRMARESREDLFGLQTRSRGVHDTTGWVSRAIDPRAYETDEEDDSATKAAKLVAKAAAGVDGEPRSSRDSRHKTKLREWLRAPGEYPFPWKSAYKCLIDSNGKFDLSRKTEFDLLWIELLNFAEREEPQILPDLYRVQRWIARQRVAANSTENIGAKWSDIREALDEWFKLLYSGRATLERVPAEVTDMLTAARAATRAEALVRERLKNFKPKYQNQKSKKSFLSSFEEDDDEPATKKRRKDSGKGGGVKWDRNGGGFTTGKGTGQRKAKGKGAKNNRRWS